MLNSRSPLPFIFITALPLLVGVMESALWVPSPLKWMTCLGLAEARKGHHRSYLGAVGGSNQPTFKLTVSHASSVCINHPMLVQSFAEFFIFNITDSHRQMKICTHIVIKMKDGLYKNGLVQPFLL
jgi:hypothetical protein